MKRLVADQKIILRNTVVNENGCWNWQRGISNGYGQFKFSIGYRSTHRMSAHLWNGFNIESKKYICHSCNNKQCCNPKHLFVGDNRINQLHALKTGILPHGENANNVKLTRIDVAAIKKLRRQGRLLKDIARQFGIGISQTHRIVNNQTWKHI